MVLFKMLKNSYYIIQITQSSSVCYIKSVMTELITSLLFRNKSFSKCPQLFLEVSYNPSVLCPWCHYTNISQSVSLGTLGPEVPWRNRLKVWKTLHPSPSLARSHVHSISISTEKPHFAFFNPKSLICRTRKWRRVCVRRISLLSFVTFYNVYDFILWSGLDKYQLLHVEDKKIEGSKC